MTRFAFAAATLLLLAACDKGADTAAGGTTATAATRPAASASRDWTQTTAATPEGGMRVGNPDAAIKLVEFASLTCPHCKTFHMESKSDLMGNYVKSGRVSYEYRNFILNGPDLALSLLTRCQGANSFFPLLDAVYIDQETILKRFTSPDPSAQARIQALPPERQIIGLADSGGFDRFMKIRGMPRARYEACLTDQQGVTALQRLRDEGMSKFNVRGTPTFVLNGETLPQTDRWAGVRTAIEALLR